MNKDRLKQLFKGKSEYFNIKSMNNRRILHLNKYTKRGYEAPRVIILPPPKTQKQTFTWGFKGRFSLVDKITAFCLRMIDNKPRFLYII